MKEEEENPEPINLHLEVGEMTPIWVHTTF